MFNRKRFEHLDRRLDKLELYFTIRDPGSAKSAEAYDGLRKSLIAAYKGTQNHMAQLAQLHRAAVAADSLEPVRSKIGEFMQQMGVVEIDDPAVLNLDPLHPSFTELFEITETGGGELVVDEPAYVAIANGTVDMVVSRGIAHFEPKQLDGSDHGHAETAVEVVQADVVRETDDASSQKDKGGNR